MVTWIPWIKHMKTYLFWLYMTDMRSF